MTGAASRSRMSLSAILLLGLLLLLAGGAAAVWALANYPDTARFLGVRGAAAPAAARLSMVPAAPMPLAAAPTAAATDTLARIAALEGRLAQVEGKTEKASGSAGRADALLVAFAARRAIDRGVALGYLEPLLDERFAAAHPQAVATVVTASRRPVRLDQLRTDFAALRPQLTSAAPGEGVWQNVRRELGTLVSIRRADQPSQRPNPTYDRAVARLGAGQVDQALAEAMRLPGIGGAGGWVRNARTYIAAHRALDEIEGAALLAR